MTNDPGSTIKVTGPASFTVNGQAYTGGGYISDPADNCFRHNLTVGSTGYLKGGKGDRFFIAGDLISSSTQTQKW